ncbi:single-stranded-DNA-specific exonuclease RecJ [Paenibacillus curdlanolyticus YK9]|uniref:Single-stranded-DNA-specific exonuclease RecJ n=1 Tax=Paenibacillus curdlanolyticus YK9 TaxID=717606 RepID=E0IDY5_9BACL|nr:single-stranded-DNA-specific exonuclease RecJ [Paenibacillus curdlanolyticus]EFM09339.1 single-stranded-DNA-specific exonuclease RecJ [Paenibacillus curdlanolyticus YK9]
MIRSKTRWSQPDWDERREQAAGHLMQALALPPLVARLLVGRGIESEEAATSFLHGGMELTHDPYLLAGMEAAVQRIRHAIEQEQWIRIYGDYDADGVSSTSLMIHLLERLGAKFDYYIPHRTREGYGMNCAAIDLAAEAGVKLIITVDTGISAVDEIAYAKAKGIEVVVTDHHEPPEVLPDAYSIINPKLPYCQYPYKSLAGVGVAFKLATALLGEAPLDLTDIVALGTIADVMPLNGENRVLVRQGLKEMALRTRPGFLALAETAGVQLQAVTSTNVAFSMAPRINASGRLDHAGGAVELLTTSDQEAAELLAARLDALNRERQRIVEEMVDEAMSQWAEKCRIAAEACQSPPAVIVLAGEGWNAGVIGIVASKMLERYYKPTVVLGIDTETGKCKGSARSIDGFDLHAALTACADLFDHFGGHQAAAGMTLHRDKLDALEQSLSDSAMAWLSPEDWVPKTFIDLACSPKEASLDTIDQLALLEPFGAGNPAPRFLFEQQPVTDKRTMGKESKHLRLALGGQPSRLEAVGFGFGELAERIAFGAQADLVGELSVNEWNGNRKPQLFIQDIRIANVQLFDWRGEREPYAMLRKLLETASRTGRRTLIVTAEHAVRETAAACARTDAAAGTYQLSSYGEPLEETLPVQELIVYGLPSSALALQELSTSLRALESIHLLYPGRSKSSPRSTTRAIFPDRTDFAAAYQSIRRQGRLAESGLAERLSEQIGWPAETIGMMIAVFEELAFITRADGWITVNGTPAKAELSSAVAYQQALLQAEANETLFGTVEQLMELIQRGRMKS